MAHSSAATAARLEALLAVHAHLLRGAPLLVVVISACTVLLWPHAPRTGLVAWAVTQTLMALGFMVFLALGSQSAVGPQRLVNDTRAMVVWLFALGVGFALGFAALAAPEDTAAYFRKASAPPPGAPSDDATASGEGAPASHGGDAAK